jgi:hypothetical protein
MPIMNAPAIYRSETADLFGDPPARKVVGGYAGRPGEGPDGETCGTCIYSLRVRHNTKCFWKCGHLRGRGVTRSEASDIRKSSPACQFWERDQ